MFSFSLQTVSQTSQRGKLSGFGLINLALLHDNLQEGGGWRMDGHMIIWKRQWTKSSFRKWPEYFLATCSILLRQKDRQTETKGASVRDCETDSCVCVCVRKREREGGGWGLESLTRKRSAEGKFPFCQSGKKKQQMTNLRPAQQLHHNAPHSISLCLTGVCCGAC